MSDAGVGAAPAAALRAADAARRRRAFGRLATRNRLAVLAALVLMTAVLAALLAPWLPLADPDVVDTPNRLRPPLAAGGAAGPDGRAPAPLTAPRGAASAAPPRTARRPASAAPTSAASAGRR